MPSRILIVDDEPEIADLVELYLQNDDYEIIKCYNGNDAMDVIRSQKLDLAILDIMLPGIDGFALCREIRQCYQFPVLMLTARTDDMDKITGLTIGADDYITKPFNPLELTARVKAQLRRYTQYNDAAKMADDSEVIDINGLVINHATHECKLYDEVLTLTPIEFNILWMLCQRRGQVISAEELFETIWGEKYLDRNNTVMVHIRRLREKLHEPSREPRFIKTVWGVGYKVE
jgi:two-component system response regulator VanR